MPDSGFSVSHSAGPLVQCNVVVCAFCHTWWQVSFVCIPHGVLSVNNKNNINNNGKRCLEKETIT